MKSKLKKTKQKTRKAAVKRFKLTATGKLLHRSQGARHLKAKKGKRRLRRLNSVKEMVGIHKKKLLQMMGEK